MSQLSLGVTRQALAGTLIQDMNLGTEGLRALCGRFFSGLYCPLCVLKASGLWQQGAELFAVGFLPLSFDLPHLFPLSLPPRSLISIP